MDAVLSSKSLGFGSVLWVGLAAYVLGVDIYALSTGKETLTESFGRALLHPQRRWLVSISWLLVSKHLFLNKYFRYLDPIGVIALLARPFSKIKHNRIEII